MPNYASRIFVLAILLVLLFPGGWATAFAPIGNPFPDPAGLSWDIQLSTIALDDISSVGVVEIDGSEATVGDVQTLHERGVIAICYINAGAREEWRPDADAYPAAIIGNAYPGWEGERFVDIRRMDLLGPIIAARLDDCAAKGFDAVDPDNVDTYNAETGFPLTATDQLAFNRWLAAEAHSRGLAIGQKNVSELAANLVDAFDFAVTEDCLVDGWCADMAPYATAGKPVLMIEYTDRDRSVAQLCELAADTFGAVVIKQRNLDAWSAHCA